MAQQVSVTLDQAVLPEGNPGDTPTQFDFVITRSGTTNEPLDVNWELRLAGTDPAEVNDFAPGQPTSGTVSFDAGVEEQTVSVLISGDLIVELDEQFELALDANGLPEGTTLDPASAVATIGNDDPTVTISPSLAQALEEGNPSDAPTKFIYTLHRDGDLSDSLTVDWAVAPRGDFPVDKDDFVNEILPSGQVTFAANEAQAVPLIEVEVNGDTIVEDDELFQVDLSLPDDAPAGTLLELESVNGTILNDDDAPSTPVVSIAQDNAEQAEGNDGSDPATAFTFTVTRSGDPAALDQVSTVDWGVRQVDPGPTVDGADFVFNSDLSGTVEFQTGDTEMPITILVNGDLDVELDEGFQVTLSNPDNAMIDVATATGTIQNDDDLPLPELSIAATDAVKLEGNDGSDPATAFTFTVTRTGDTTGESTVAWAVGPLDSGPTVDGLDFVPGTPTFGRLKFDDGQEEQTITLQVNGDLEDELDEGFTVSLFSPTDATIDVATAAGTIQNDDDDLPLPELSIEATDADKLEGNDGSDPATAFTFTVTRTGDTTGESTVAWATSQSGEDPAEADDFIGDTFGTLTFDQGDDEQTITLLVNGDLEDELDEGFTVTLSNPDNATIDVATATGTIENDDVELPPAGSEPTEGNDTILGTDGPDVIEALEGNDIVLGKGSGDLLIGDREFFNPDDLTAIGGDDFISGGDGDDVIYGDAVDEEVGLTAAQRGGNDVLLGDAGNDTLIGDAEVVRESAVGGDDLLIAGEGEAGGTSTLVGDARLLTGNAQGGRDVLVGGDSADDIIGDADLIREGARGGEDELFGGGGDDSLYGDAITMEGFSLPGNDRLEGGPGNDTLWGDATSLLDVQRSATDGFVFSSGDGQDTIGDFQPGVDKIVLAGVTAIEDFDDLVANHLTEVTVQTDPEEIKNAQIDTDNGFVGENTILLSGFTVDDFTNGRIDADDFVFSVITGTTGEDTIPGTAGADIINALGGNDMVDGAGGGDIIDGGDGNDELEGGEGDDALRGQDGDDQVRGGAGADRLEGGIGADTLQGGDDNDILEGQDGNDTLDGGEDNDTLAGGAGDDVLIGGAGVDTADFSGGEAVEADLALGKAEGQGSDTLSGIENLTGSRGNDILTGDGNANTILGNPGVDEIDGGAGADVLVGGEGADDLFGGEDNDTLDGGDDGDELEGGSGDDTLLGGEGEDDLRGGPDNDILDGGDNDDSLDGGSGEDIFRFTGNTNEDTILEFIQGEDKIDLSDYPSIQSVLDLKIDFDPRRDTTEISDYKGITDSILLENFDSDLTNDDFIFAGGNSIYISDVQIEEGNDGSTTDAVFTVSLSTPVDAQVTVDYATADGTATAGSDYTEVSGTLTFAPGETVQQVRVPILGDGTVELDESFFVNLSNPVNDVIADGQGEATILDDDGSGVDQTGTSADEVLDGTDGDDLLQGGNGDDALSGADGDDALTGGAGDDSLSGGSGDDQLSGGAGNDALIGGSGNDTFVFRAADGDSGHDTIRLFNADEDTLAFEEYGERLDAFSDLDTNTNGVLDDGDAHVSVDAGDTVIDLGGQTDGASDGTLTLVGVTGIEADDMAFS